MAEVSESVVGAEDHVSLLVAWKEDVLTKAAGRQRGRRPIDRSKVIAETKRRARALRAYLKRWLGERGYADRCTISELGGIGMLVVHCDAEVADALLVCSDISDVSVTRDQTVPCIT